MLGIGVGLPLRMELARVGVRTSVAAEVDGAAMVLTDSGSRWSKMLLAPVSSVAMRFISSSVSWKSKTSRFSAMRSGRTDFGMTTMPRWMSQRRTTWATVLLCPVAISVRTGLVNRSSRPWARGPLFPCRPTCCGRAKLRGARRVGAGAPEFVPTDQYGNGQLTSPMRSTRSLTPLRSSPRVVPGGAVFGVADGGWVSSAQVVPEAGTFRSTR